VPGDRSTSLRRPHRDLPRRREPAGSKIKVRPSLWFSQAQTNGRGCSALGAVRRPATRAEYRHQNFRRFAADRTIRLDGANAGDACVTLRTCVTLGTRLTFGTDVTLWAHLTLGTRRALRTLRPLCAGLALCSRDALHALRPLRAGWTLRTWLALRPGIPAACTKCQSHTDYEYRKNPHATPPCYPAVIGGYRQYACNPVELTTVQRSHETSWSSCGSSYRTAIAQMNSAHASVDEIVRT
jgi:hypothetical protein